MAPNPYQSQSIRLKIFSFRLHNCGGIKGRDSKIVQMIRKRKRWWKCSWNEVEVEVEVEVENWKLRNETSWEVRFENWNFRGEIWKLKVETWAMTVLRSMLVITLRTCVTLSSFQLSSLFKGYKRRGVGSVSRPIPFIVYSRTQHKNFNLNGLRFKVS